MQQLASQKKEYEYVKRSSAKIFNEYERYVVGDSGNHLQEFKFEEFKKLPREKREGLASQIGKTIKLAGGFIMGFYTHVAGVVDERVRTNLIGDADVVPDDHKALYDEAAAELGMNSKGWGSHRQLPTSSEFLCLLWPTFWNPLAVSSMCYAIQESPRKTKPFNCPSMIM